MKWKYSGPINFALVSLLIIVGFVMCVEFCSRGEPITRASAAGDLEEVQRLVAEGVDVNTQERKARTPLQEAARFGHAEIVQLLLRHGGDPNIAEADAGFTPLAFAVKGGQSEVLRILLSHNADVRERDWRYAEAGESEEILALLKESQQKQSRPESTND
jgi:tankyrase